MEVGQIKLDWLWKLKDCLNICSTKRWIQKFWKFRSSTSNSSTIFHTVVSEGVIRMAVERFLMFDWFFAGGIEKAGGGVWERERTAAKTYWRGSKCCKTNWRVVFEKNTGRWYDGDLLRKTYYGPFHRNTHLVLMLYTIMLSLSHQCHNQS